MKLANAMNRPSIWMTILYAILLASATAFAFTTHGCSQALRPARIAVVTTGSALTAIHAEHQRAYRTATDALIARLRASHGTLADYDREREGIDDAFHIRGEAIATIASALYATAAIIDSADSGDRTSILRAARSTLDLLLDAVQTLHDARVLPEVQLPGDVQVAIGLLRQLLSEGDAGTEGASDAGH